MDWHYLRWRSTLILGVFRKMADAMLEDPVLRAQVYLTPEEEELIQIPTGFRTVLPTGRLDSFFTVHPDGRYTLNYVELNGESPASMAYSDVLAELFLETPLMQRFQERYHVDTLMGRRQAVDALLRIYFTWRGNRDKLPDIAIVDWKGVPTTTEFQLFVDYFARYGITVTICDPHDMEFRDGVLYAAGPAGGLRLQARAHHGTPAEIRAGSSDHRRAARRRHLHGQSVSLQDGAQESQLRRGLRRAQCLSVRCRRACGHPATHPMDARRGRAHDR